MSRTRHCTAMFLLNVFSMTRCGRDSNMTLPRQQAGMQSFKPMLRVNLNFFVLVLYLSIYLTIYLTIYLSIYLSIYPICHCNPFNSEHKPDFYEAFFWFIRVPIALSPVCIHFRTCVIQLWIRKLWQQLKTQESNGAMGCL